MIKDWAIGNFSSEKAMDEYIDTEGLIIRTYLDWPDKGRRGDIIGHDEYIDVKGDKYAYYKTIKQKPCWTPNRYVAIMVDDGYVIVEPYKGRYGEGYKIYERTVYKANYWCHYYIKAE